MTVNPAPQPDLAQHLRSLIAAVKEARARWGWLGAPMALLAWFRMRRERAQAAAAMEAVQGLLTAFLAMFEDYKAGRLPIAQPLPIPHPSPLPQGEREIATPENARTPAPARRAGEVRTAARGQPEGADPGCGAVQSHVRGHDVVEARSTGTRHSRARGNPWIPGAKRPVAVHSTRPLAVWARPPPPGFFENGRVARGRRASS